MRNEKIVKQKQKQKNQVMVPRPQVGDLFAVMGPDARPPSRLAFVRLAQGQSRVVSEGRARPGDFVLGKDAENLGREVFVVPAAGRLRAARWGDGKLIEESADHTDEVFRAIQADARARVPGCEYGPEVVLWLPEQQTFALMHFVKGNAFVGAEALKLIGKVATLRAVLREGTSFTWWAPTIELVEDPGELEQPTQDQVREALAAFTNPKAEPKGTAMADAMDVPDAELPF